MSSWGVPTPTQIAAHSVAGGWWQYRIEGENALPRWRKLTLRSDGRISVSSGLVLLEIWGTVPKGVLLRPVSFPDGDPVPVSE